jgi:hypoxanthine-DNA glycosylase
MRSRLRHRGFPPVIDDRVKVLILGSFPSPASLEKQQYYGHPQNHFWKLMGALLDEALYEMDSRSAAGFAKARIGLWDRIASVRACRRARQQYP